MAGEDEELPGAREAAQNLDAPPASLTVPVDEDFVDEEGKTFTSLIEVVHDRESQRQIRLLERASGHRRRERYRCGQAPGPST